MSNINHKPDKGSKMVNSIKDLNEFFQQGFIWIFTGVSAFLAYSTWNMSVSMSELAAEVRHLTNQNEKYDTKFETFQNGLFSIREEQLNLSKSVYDAGIKYASIIENKKDIDALRGRVERLEGKP